LVSDQSDGRKILKTALVVGAGPAGTSTALALLGRGIDVTVLDRRLGLGPRVCGAFLDGEAIRHLDSLGMGAQVRTQSVPVPGTWISVGASRDQRVNFTSPGLALPRPKLEGLLLEALKDRGGKIRWGITVKSSGPQCVSLQGPGIISADPPTLFADTVIWADGRFSRQDPASLERDPHGWYGWNAAFSGIAQKPGEMSLYFLPNGYVGILTFKDGTSNVCGLKRRGETVLGWATVFEETRKQSPSFRFRTEGATRLTAWQGVGPLPFTGGLRPDDGFIHVGDSSAVGDPFMGEGIGRALGSGPLLARIMHAGPRGNDTVSKDFRQHWSAAYHRRFELGTLLRWVLNRPRLSGFILKSLLIRPRVAKILLPYFHK
jgi:2-polyprenyl-6-methoxyphenol hydroxylase-like FAD-dependent oxidoreductase